VLRSHRVMVSGAAQDPLVGQVLSGRYRILAKVGEGAMAAVYLAEHTAVGKTIVLKVLLPQHASEAHVVEAFLREARIAAEIHHDNVIDIFYSGRSPEGFVFLAMEYVKGSTLWAVLAEEGALPWDRAKPWLLQIAGALAAAHAMGVVHRDVKPENVLVGERDEAAGGGTYVKVVDFGIANARGELGGEGVCGTPEFMPPEQAQGLPPDARDDVYAFGCLMYQVLTGDVPFRADDVPRLLLMHLRDPVVPPRSKRPDLDIPPAAQDIVMRALEKRREDRFQSMAEVQTAIAAVELEAEPPEPPMPAGARLATSGAPGKPSSLRARVQMPKEHSRLRARLPLVLGLALLVGGGGFVLVQKALLHSPGRIEIATEPAEADIYVDGQKMADRSPMLLDASPGSYKVVVRSAGYETLERVLEMKPGAHERVSLILTALPGTKITVAAPTAPPPRPRPAASLPTSIGAAARRKAGARGIDGVTFIDFKKASTDQTAR
jgi:tRNA A-37 threonylcarbamoyl transferase component Bud32